MSSRYTKWSSVSSPRLSAAPLNRSKSAESRITTASIHPDFQGYKAIFYKNGDLNDIGTVVSLNARLFPTFGSLCTYLSNKVFVPGGVHKIYTTQGRTVTRLTQFKPDHEYVACCSFLIRGDYGKMRRVTDRYDVNLPATPRYEVPPLLDEMPDSPRSFRASPRPGDMTLASYPN